MRRDRGTRYATFRATLRGYDSEQVDHYLDAAEAAVAAGRRPAEPPGFDTALRGYDRDAVDTHIATIVRT